MSMDVQKREKILDLIGGIDSLPTLPHVASQIMEAAMSSGSSIRNIAEILSKDPALASKVLKVANSAFYGLKQQVNSLELALVVLGMHEINHLVLSVSVFSAFSDKNDETDFSREKFWEHSAACGHFARILCKKLKETTLGGEAFVGGLLHDIGKIVLDEFNHDKFMLIVKRAAEEETGVYEIEMDELGFSHADIGAVLAEKWNLPPSVVDVIHNHHQPINAEASPFVVAVVRIADLFCKAKDIGFGGDRKPFVMEEDLSWQIIQKTKPELKNLDIEKLTYELDDEIDKVKEFVAINRGK